MIKKYLFTIFISLFSVIASATPWQIMPEKSHLNFTAIQNNAPVTGEFKKFNGEINFATDQLKTSNVRIVIDINSVTTSYSDVAVTLKTPEWFDAKIFPQAIFTANNFTQTGKNSYQAAGELTIRDKTAPVMLQFTLENYTPTQAFVTGTTTLKRSVFGVGRGEWAKTDEVKDDVKITFTLTATKK